MANVTIFIEVDDVEMDASLFVVSRGVANDHTGTEIAGGGGGTGLVLLDWFDERFNLEFDWCCSKSRLLRVMVVLGKGRKAKLCSTKRTPIKRVKRLNGSLRNLISCNYD
jgi:hypothetical protein